jgi:hypothetical protein
MLKCTKMKKIKNKNKYTKYGGRPHPQDWKQSNLVMFEWCSLHPSMLHHILWLQKSQHAFPGKGSADTKKIWKSMAKNIRLKF